MNYKSIVIAAASILAIGVLLLGVMLKSGIVGFKESERVVTVKGLSERVVDATDVIWPLKYKIVGNELPSLYTKMEQTNNQIITFLKNYGISENDISIAIPIVIDVEADQYYSPQNGPRFRYNITSAITVASKDIEKVRKAMSNVTELIKAGIAVNSDLYGTSTVVFSFNALNDIKPTMIEEATKNARQAAEKFAIDSNSKLGKIKYANQGQFSISEPDNNSPHIKAVRVVTTVEYYLKD